MIFDVAIIGAGPAGISCALQLKRSGIDPVIFEKGIPGGLLKHACLVENYPGFPNGIPGAALAELFASQLENTGVQIRKEEVIKLDHDGIQFVLSTPERELQTRVAVIASGTSLREPYGLRIPEICSPYIIYEIYPILKSIGKTIAIIGAGDAALDHALNLGEQNKIVILNRGASSNALKLLQDRVTQISSIEYRINTSVTGIDSTGSGLRLELSGAGTTSMLDTDYLVIAIGRDACLDFVGTQFRNRMNELEDIGSLWRIGDVRNGKYRQVSISVGDGIRAAMEIFDKLEERKQ